MAYDGMKKIGVNNKKTTPTAQEVVNKANKRI